MWPSLLRGALFGVRSNESKKNFLVRKYRDNIHPSNSFREKCERPVFQSLTKHLDGSSPLNVMGSLLKKLLKNKVREGTLLWSILRKVKNISKYFLTLRFKSLFAYAHREFIARNSIFLFEDELFMASLFPKKILDKTIELFAPKSVLDIGCGTGQALDYFLEHRIDALGIEGSALAIQQARNADKIMQYNLEQPLNLHRKFDMIWSYEVVEHIRPKFLNNLLTTFSNHADLIVLSAARPGQGGVGHFNEQPESYWIENFSRFGFSKHERATQMLRMLHEIFAENILVFGRKVQY